MSLTGPGLPLLVALLLIAALVAVFVLRTRVRGPRWVRGGQRFLLLVSTQMFTVVLVAVLVNDAGGFFTSWSDLFETDNAAISRYVVRADHDTNATIRRAADRVAFSTPQQHAALGELMSVTIDGATSGLRAAVDVYLPPEYFQRPYAKQAFPVVVVLGPPGARLSPASLRATASSYLRQLRATTAAPAVLALLDLPPAGGTCLDTARSPHVPEFLADDLPIALSRVYRVRPLGWGVVGNDAGGYCAAKMALTNPYVYFAGASIDGYFVPPRDGSVRGARPGARDGLSYLNDLEQRLRTLPAPSVKLLLVRTPAGATSSVQQASAVRALAKAPLRITDRAVQSSVALSTAVSWLSVQLPPPTTPQR